MRPTCQSKQNILEKPCLHNTAPCHNSPTSSASGTWGCSHLWLCNRPAADAAPSHPSPFLPHQPLPQPCRSRKGWNGGVEAAGWDPFNSRNPAGGELSAAAALAVPPALGSSLLCAGGGWAAAGRGCAGLTPSLGWGISRAAPSGHCPGQACPGGLSCTPSPDAFSHSLLGTGRTQPLLGEGALPGKGREFMTAPWEEASGPQGCPPAHNRQFLGLAGTPLQHQASLVAPRFNTLLENERLEHVPEEKEIYCCPGPAAKQNSNNPGVGRTINPCWQSHCSKDGDSHSKVWPVNISHI